MTTTLAERLQAIVGSAHVVTDPDVLDGRSVEPYPPGTIIPNPARRRLDRALRLARVAEGDARRALARFAEGDKRHVAAREDLADALQRIEFRLLRCRQIVLHAFAWQILGQCRTTLTLALVADRDQVLRRDRQFNGL